MATDRGNRLDRDDGSMVPVVATIQLGPGGATGGGFTAAQTSPATVAFASGNTADGSGGNATVTQAVAANASRTYLALFNNGPADVELWLGAKPADSNVGLTPKRGLLIPANGGGFVWDSKYPTSAVYASTTAAGVLSIIEG